MSQANAIAKAFGQLHKSGRPVLLANVWNISSARTVAAIPSCKALATTSFGIARTIGTEDNKMTLDAHLEALKPIAAVAREFDKPLTVDFQSGYGSQLEEGIGKLINLGVSGANLEDCDNDKQLMYSQEEAAARVQRTIKLASSHGVPDFVLNARCDTLANGGDFEDMLSHGKAYLSAGASCVFVLPGPQRKLGVEDIQTMVEEFGGKLNIGWNPASAFSIKELAEAGVSRVSVGPGIQLRAMELVTKAAMTIMTSV